MITDGFSTADPLALLAAAVVGYLFGSVNPAAIIARMRGIDLHHEGLATRGPRTPVGCSGRRPAFSWGCSMSPRA
ncbi:MAG: hypothetical protein U0R64_03705 [Candidatus Nanopelagicales bacterium]